MKFFQQKGYSRIHKYKRDKYKKILFYTHGPCKMLINYAKYIEDIRSGALNIYSKVYQVESSEAVYKAIKEAGIDFVVSLPCVNLGKVMELVDCDEDIIHVPVTREEEGFGICAGAFLGGKKPAILMQNSGLGNSVNVLASLYELYRIPILMIMSHRGTEGEFMSAQIPMGKATPGVLDALNIAYLNPKTPEEALELIPQAWKLSEMGEAPIGILLEITFWKN